MKKNKSAKYYLSDKQLEKVKRQISKDMTDKVALLMLAAVADEFGSTEDDLAKLMVRVDRYANHIDNHLVKMKDIRKSIENSTGMKLTGW